MDSSATPSDVDAVHGEDLDTRGTRGAVWRVDRNWRETIMGDHAPCFFALEHDTRAVRIKDGAGRTTWRLACGGKSVFCKVYEPARGWARLKRLLAGPPARQEFERARMAARRGVAVAGAIAWGRQTAPPYRTVVVLSEIARATALTDYAFAPPAASDLIDALARLLAGAHDAGFVHRDGHPGNILIRHEPTTGYTAWFVDLHAGRIHRRKLSARCAARALGQLDHHYARVATPRQRLRFLARYLATRRNAPQERFAIRAFVERVRRASHAHAVRLAWHRDRRLRTSNKYFARLDLDNGWHARVVLTLARRRITPATHVADRSEGEWSNILGAWFAKRTPAHEPAPRPDQPGANTHCLITHHQGFGRRLLLTLLGSPARRAFEHCHRLRHRDLPTPLVLGYGERRRFGLIDTSALILAVTRDEQASSQYATIPNGGSVRPSPVAHGGTKP